MIILGEYNCYYSNGRAYEILNPARMEDQLLSSVIKN